MHAPSSTLRTLVLLAVLAVSAAASARAQMPQPPAPTVRVETSGEPDSLAFLALDPARIPHRRLRDRVPAFVSDDSLSGTGGVRAASWGQWRQLYHELQRSRVRGARALPDLDEISARAQGHALAGRVPLALQHVRYARLRRDAVARGLVRVENGRLRDVPGAASPYEARQAFAAAAFVRGGVHHGLTVRFVVDGSLVVSGEGARARRMRVDAGDGTGWREVRLGDEVVATYASAGEQTVMVEATYGNETLTAQTTLAVAEAEVPPPNFNESLSLLFQQSTRRYDNVPGGYHAFVWPGRDRYTNQVHTSIRRPVIVVEGFDPDAWKGISCVWPCYYTNPLTTNGGRTWQALYRELGAMPRALDSLGYDLVLMKLHNAGDFVQRNAFALQSLIESLKARIPAGQEIVVVGPSMGGLVARYALSDMERAGIDHRVKLFVAFDAPLGGANVPLGLQAFVDFMAPHNDEAHGNWRSLNQPAARQMLLYHSNTWGCALPYSTYGGPTDLRVQLLAELAALPFPRRVGMRRIAIANGSGVGAAQQGNGVPMQPGSEILHHSGGDWRVTADSRVYALPLRASFPQHIFQGYLNKVVSTAHRCNVWVTNAHPYDHASGGSRNSMERASGRKAYGTQISTNFPRHSFIPTISALDLPTADPTRRLDQNAADLVGLPQAGDSFSLGTTAQFDALHYETENTEHVSPTGENSRFLFAQLLRYASLPLPPQPLTVTLGGPTSAFFGQSATFFAHPAGGVASYTYTWYLDGEDTGARGQSFTTDLHPPTTVSVSVTSGAQVQWAFHAVEASGGGDCDPTDWTCAGPLEARGVEGAEMLPTEVRLHAPSPNPARGWLRVRYDLPEATAVRVAVYDVLGRQLAQAVDEVVGAGYHAAELEVSGWAPGVYVVVVEAGGTRASHRVLVQR